jgi:hypothetical protein
MKSLLQHVAVVACVFLFLEWLVPVPSGAGVSVLFVHHMAVTVLALVIPTLFLLYRYRSVVAVALAAASENGSRERRPLLRYLESQIRELKRRMGSIQDGSLAVGEEDLRQLTRRCFESATDAYIGVVSNVPSDYMSRFHFYLEEHQNGIHQNRWPSARILLVEAQELQQDQIHHVQVVRNFVEWHISHGVLLLQANPTVAAEFAKVARLGTTDLALWIGSYAILLFPVGPSSSSEAISKIQFSPRGQESYQRTKSYISELNAIATRIQLDAHSVKLVHRSDGEKAALSEGLTGADE